MFTPPSVERGNLSGTGQSLSAQIGRVEPGAKTPHPIGNGISVGSRTHGNSVAQGAGHVQGSMNGAPAQVPAGGTSTHKTKPKPRSLLIPRSFGVTMCCKCKYQSKGYYYCRVQMLHLFAPGWQQEQSKAWEIPRGFLRWLRLEGHVQGCQTDEDVIKLARGRVHHLDTFPWYSSPAWNPAMYELPIFKQAGAAALALGEFGNDGRNRGARRTPSPLSATPATQQQQQQQQRLLAAAAGVGPVVQASLNPAASAPPLAKDRAVPGSAPSSSSAADLAGARWGAGVVSASANGGQQVASAPDPARASSPVDDVERAHWRVKEKAAAELAITIEEALSREPAIDLTADDSHIRGRSAGASSGAGTNGVLRPAAGVYHPLDPEGDGRTPSPLRGPGTGAIAGTRVFLPPGASATHRGIVVSRSSGSPEERSCMEGSSGSAWKGIVRSSPKGSGSYQHPPGPRDPEWEAQVEAGRQVVRTWDESSRRAHERYPGVLSAFRSGAAAAPKGDHRKRQAEADDDDCHERRAHEGLAARDAREAERQRYFEKRTDSRRRAKELEARRRTEEDETRRARDQQEMRRLRELARLKAKELREREHEADRRSKATIRREQLAYWVDERPVLAKIQNSDSARPPAVLVVQDLYRNALLKMQKLDEPLRRRPTIAPTTSHDRTGTGTSLGGGNDDSASARPPCSAIHGVAGTVNNPHASLGAIGPALIAWREDTASAMAAEWPGALSAMEGTSGSAAAGGSRGQQSVPLHSQPRSSRLPRRSFSRATPRKHNQDLRNFYHRNDLQTTVDSTREALRARLHYWARDIPVYVERGGMMANAPVELPVDMSIVKTTPSPAEWSSWAGRSLDTWKGLVALSPKVLCRRRHPHRGHLAVETEDSERIEEGHVDDHLRPPDPTVPRDHQNGGGGGSGTDRALNSGSASPDQVTAPAGVRKRHRLYDLNDYEPGNLVASTSASANGSSAPPKKDASSSQRAIEGVGIASSKVTAPKPSQAATVSKSTPAPTTAPKPLSIKASASKSSASNLVPSPKASTPKAHTAKAKAAKTPAPKATAPDSPRPESSAPESPAPELSDSGPSDPEPPAVDTLLDPELSASEAPDTIPAAPQDLPSTSYAANPPASSETSAAEVSSLAALTSAPTDATAEKATASEEAKEASVASATARERPVAPPPPAAPEATVKITSDAPAQKPVSQSQLPESTAQREEPKGDAERCRAEAPDAVSGAAVSTSPAPASASVQKPAPPAASAPGPAKTSPKAAAPSNASVPPSLKKARPEEVSSPACSDAGDEPVGPRALLPAPQLPRMRPDLAERAAGAEAPPSASGAGAKDKGNAIASPGAKDDKPAAKKDGKVEASSAGSGSSSSSNGKGRDNAEGEAAGTSRKEAASDGNAVADGHPSKKAKYFRVPSKERLPPGWKTTRDESSRGKQFACTYYVYTKSGAHQKFKNLRDVENFLNSQDPEAERHRTAIVAGKVQGAAWRPGMKPKAKTKPRANSPKTTSASSVAIGNGGSGSGGRSKGSKGDSSAGSSPGRSPTAMTAKKSKVSKVKEGKGQDGGAKASKKDSPRAGTGDAATKSKSKKEPRTDKNPQGVKRKQSEPSDESAKAAGAATATATADGPSGAKRQKSGSSSPAAGGPAAKGTGGAASKAKEASPPTTPREDGWAGKKRGRPLGSKNKVKRDSPRTADAPPARPPAAGVSVPSPVAKGAQAKKKQATAAAAPARPAKPVESRPTEASDISAEVVEKLEREKAAAMVAAALAAKREKMKDAGGKDATAQTNPRSAQQKDASKKAAEEEEEQADGNEVGETSSDAGGQAMDVLPPEITLSGSGGASLPPSPDDDSSDEGWSDGDEFVDEVEAFAVGDYEGEESEPGDAMSENETGKDKEHSEQDVAEPRVEEGLDVDEEETSPEPAGDPKGEETEEGGVLVANETMASGETGDVAVTAAEAGAPAAATAAAFAAADVVATAVDETAVAETAGVVSTEASGSADALDAEAAAGARPSATAAATPTLAVSTNATPDDGRPATVEDEILETSGSRKKPRSQPADSQDAPGPRRKKRVSDEMSDQSSADPGDAGSTVSTIRRKEGAGTELETSAGPGEGDKPEEATELEEADETDETDRSLVGAASKQKHKQRPDDEDSGGPRQGKKIGNKMMKRILALAAGAIGNPSGKRKRKAPSISGTGSTSGSGGAVSTISPRDRRKRVSLEGRGNDVAGGVSRSSRDRGASNHDGNPPALRQSSRAAAAAASAALRG